ncbi:unnamed protein product [Nippostrongylus brasiliensis]|uniref:Uncharacterized protein n=1 Tax=Nippostrongylus brasiliensis TaxID=27835 RepID=A0A0N4Y1N3_NIPBR|nr:unnamed protein product [Nippostrongylus brasiliensis]
MIRNNVMLYAERNDYQQIPAYKCFRDLIKVRAFNLLCIRTTHQIIGRERLSISATDCNEAVLNKIIHGHHLKQLLPGVFSTEEIDEQNNSLPLLGRTIYTRSMYSFWTASRSNRFGGSYNVNGKFIRNAIIDNHTQNDTV